MAWCARLLAALLLTFVVGVGGAAAHIGGSAYIAVTADFLLPGRPFEVMAADMGADASVALRIEHEPRVATLGTIRAAPDGQFMTHLVLPADFPMGYARLFVTAATGAAVWIWVLVGERTASTPPPPGSGSWWTDPSVLVLLMFLIGAVGVVGYVRVRPRRAGIEAVRAAPRGVPRQRKRDRRPGC